MIGDPRTGAPEVPTAAADVPVIAIEQLAKRQMTWLRSMPARRAIACDAPDAIARLLQQVKAIA